MGWLAYFDHIDKEKWDRPEKLEFYMAQLSADIQQLRLTISGFFGKVDEIPIDSRLLKFGTKRGSSPTPPTAAQSNPSSPEKPTELPPEEKERRLHRSKAAWFAAVGLRPDGSAPKVVRRKAPRKRGSHGVSSRTGKDDSKD